MIKTYIYTAPNGREFIAMNLSEDQKSFLKGYTPKSFGFTSVEEYDEGVSKLNLSDCENTEELRAVRNSVVMFYRSLMDKEIIYDANGNFKGRNDAYWDYSEGCNSVTAIIDNYSYGRTA